MAGEKGLSEGEHSVLIVHPHWKTVLWPAVVFVVMAIAASVAEIVIPAGSTAAYERIGVAVLAALVVLRWSAIPFLRWRATIYQLTTRRLRLREGVLARSGRDFPLIRISDVSFSHGLLDRMLRCGRLVVESAGEHGQLVLTEIPHVEKVQALLFQLVEDEQTRVGRETEQP